MILDLSGPEGHSVNDGIRKEPFLVQCVTLDDIVDGIMSFDRTVLLVTRFVGFERFYGAFFILFVDSSKPRGMWGEEYLPNSSLPYGGFY